jgi:microcystin-dependent protein
MSQPFVGEIRCFGFNFAPTGWAFCNGQLLSIQQNTALFTLLGTTYGGDGQQTFALPDLRGRVPIHWGTSPAGFSTTIGQTLGTETVALAGNQVAAHNHAVVGEIVAPGGANEHIATPATGAFIGPSSPDQVYNSSPIDLNVAFAASAVGFNGGSQPHENRQPLLVFNFCISLVGIFPSQN